MMTTYFQGVSDIQPTSDNLQTLYLMNPNNYLPSCSEQTHTPQTTPSMLLLNPSHALGQGSIPHAPQHLLGIPLPGPHPDNPNRPSYHYNLWDPTAIPPTMDSPMGFRRPTSGPHTQGLSLSLSPHQRQNHPSAVITTAGCGGGGGGGSSVSNGVEGMILGSKYLKATQELLDEVVSVGSTNNKAVIVNDDNNHSSGAHKKKSKEIEFSSGGGGGGGGGEGGSGSKPPVESLTTAQRQELQMKKAKLLNMLDEVEQRYKQYQTQMQVVISSFEQVSGTGSAKSYTSLALQTISRQFRCLKDAILSQIKTTAKTLGEENTNNSNNNNMGKVEGSALTNASRLKFIDHQLRQQRALHQLGVMHQHNAWRPQRGLPERAVSVLRAWLFEHFLHPYPKDSDKHILAKQTGLTRSQVSNWFINARVRLWKPMVEEMYMEEMKSQDQKGNNSDNNNNNNNANPLSNDHNKDQSTSKTIATPQQHHQEQQPNNTNDGIIHHLPHQSENHPTNDMISNMSTMSTTSTQGFTLVGSSSDMESLMGQSPKKQRSGSDMQNSPSSILSMDMEIKSSYQINKYSQDPKNTPMISNGSGLNPYVIPNIGRFNPDQIGTHRYHQGNSVSLTLGLPHCENLPSLSNNEQHNFIQNQGIQLGRRIEIGVGEGEFCGISMGQSSHPSNVYDSIDIQSRKRFATQLLHDFVA